MFMALLPALAGTALASEKAIGEISKAEGDCAVIYDSGSEEARYGAELYSGNTLVTDEDGRIEARLQDGTMLAMAPESRLTLDEYVYDPQGETASKVAVEWSKGFFRMVTGEIAERNPENVSIRTPLAYVGIRGTGLFCQKLESGEENIGVESMDLSHVVFVKTEIDEVEIREAGLYTRVGLDGSLMPPARIPTRLLRNVMQGARGSVRMQVRPRP
jgi:hypothetical protein